MHVTRMSHACHTHVRFGDAESFRPCAAMCQSSPQRSLCCPTAERTGRPRRAGRRDAYDAYDAYVMMFQLVVQPCAAIEGADPAVSLFCCSTFPQGGKLFFSLMRQHREVR